MTRRRNLPVVTASTLAALAVMTGALSLAHNPAGAQTPASTATISLVAVDAIPEGNTATTLAAIDSCARVEPGAQAVVDLVVDTIPADRPMIAFQMAVTYDPNLLEVTKYDQNMLLGAVGRYEPFQAFNDPVPDTDGKLDMGILDLASNDGDPKSNTESGRGVLVRVTFQAKAAGISTIAITPARSDEYPAIMDYLNTPTGIDRLGAAKVAVGEDCPAIAPGELITPLPPIETTAPSPAAAASPAAPPAGTGITAESEDSGPSAGLIILATVLGGGGLAAAAGGWLLYQRRRAGTKS